MLATSQRQYVLSGIASHLVYDGLLDPDSAKNIIHQAKEQNTLVITYIVKNNILSSEQIVNSCAKHFGLSTFDLKNYDSNWLKNLTLNADMMRRYHVIPLSKQNNLLHIGISDPTDRTTLDSIAFYTGMRIVPVIVAENQLSQLLIKYFSDHSANHLEISLLKKISPDEISSSIHENTVNYDEPLILFVDNIIQHAIQRLASDIHIESYEQICRIRYRQDGILYEVAEIPINIAHRLVTRLKVMAKLDISDRRLPQDGRFQAHTRDIRINTCPTLFGEKVVLRLLNTNKMILDMNTLGFTENQKHIFLEKISQAQGMILVTGPTGSGKTVTLYSALNHLNTPDKNISTVEDPIEIQLRGINQVNIHPKIGLCFSTVLRALLRQDPDIMMVGEIRDKETAEIAIQASQTGHLILSTLHTNSAIEAITRLQSMGIAAYNIINSISLIIAQRLIRKLCPHCKQPDNYAPGFRAVGCQQCLQGYQGRVGIYELLPLTDTLKKLISSAEPHALSNHLQHENYLSLKQVGLEKIAQGISTMNEINRVLQK